MTEPPSAPGVPRPAATTLYHGFQLSVSGLFTYQHLLDEDLYLGGAEAFLGAERNFWELGGRVRILGGRTRAGLNAFAFSLGPAVEFLLGQWIRIGLGIDIGNLALFRVTKANSFLGLVVDGHVQLGVDVVHLPNGGALFIGGRFAAGAISSSYNPAVIGATALLGYRFFGPQRRK